MTFSQIKMSGKVTDSLGTPLELANIIPVSYTHLRAHET